MAKFTQSWHKHSWGKGFRVYSDEYLSQCKKRQLSKKGKYIANLQKKNVFQNHGAIFNKSLK